MNTGFSLVPLSRCGSLRGLRPEVFSHSVRSEDKVALSSVHYACVNRDGILDA